MSVRAILGFSVKAMVFAAIFAPCAAFSADPEVVGGITPSRRPANAPVINAVHYGPDWYKRGLTGVSQPYPQSLYFLEQQGEWYTPFTRVGMPKPYDIRGWYK